MGHLTPPPLTPWGPLGLPLDLLGPRLPFDLKDPVGLPYPLTPWDPEGLSSDPLGQYSPLQPSTAQYSPFYSVP